MLIYTSVGITLMAMAFGAFFYFNLGNSEKALAATSDYTSHDKQEGIWKNATTWDRIGTWLSPTPASGAYWRAEIKGIVAYAATDPSDVFICTNGSTLNITDTLIIKGSILISGGAQVNVLSTGVLIILGDLTASGGSQLKNKGRVVVTHNLAVGGGAKINNTPTGNNGFYLYGTKERLFNSGDYGRNHKSEADLEANDNPLYLYVNGLQNELLPITLLSFTAQKAGNAIKLAWSTASEINNDFFTIERSTNGMDWKAIKNIEGAKNSNIKLDYHYEDTTPLPGYNYYRLKQTDFNGDFEYFKIVGVNVGDNNLARNTFKNLKSIEVTPNPFKEFITITYTAQSSDPITFIIRDLAGVIVRKKILNPQQGKNEYSFNQTSELKPGVYIINMIKNGKSESVKVIKI